ncbi:hypothetical protein X975_14908, partial [Stegodyphus mimosarum]
ITVIHLILFLQVLRNHSITVLFVGQRLEKHHTGNSSNCLRILLSKSLLSLK